MKTDTTLKDVFSAALNLSMSHMDKETYLRYSKIIDHNQRTINLLILGAIVLVAICVFLKNINLNLFHYIPGALFLLLFIRYKDLYKLSLEGIKSLKKKSEPEVGADLT